MKVDEKVKHRPEVSVLDSDEESRTEEIDCSIRCRNGVDGGADQDRQPDRRQRAHDEIEGGGIQECPAKLRGVGDGAVVGDRCIASFTNHSILQ